MGNGDSKVDTPVDLADLGDDKKYLLSTAIVGENIASSAVDSIRDSQETGNELAKMNIICVLTNKDSIPKFGELLKYSFSYESVLKPTRELLYWSLQSDDSFNSLKYMSKSNLSEWTNTTGKIDLIPPITQWIKSRETRIVTVLPLLSWTLREKSVSLEPLAAILVDSIPYTKASTVENLKYYALEALKSNEVKQIAKDGLVRMLRVSAGQIDDTSSADEENSKS